MDQKRTSTSITTNTPQEEIPDSPSQETAHSQKNNQRIIIIIVIFLGIFLLLGLGLFIYQTKTNTLGQGTSLSTTENQLSQTITNEQINRTVVDTKQHYCFSDTSVISCGQSFTEQDAQYQGNEPSYTDNGNGTITDNNTGLMWTKAAETKQYYQTAIANVKSYTYAGYSDWRVPTIKELYSLIEFSGTDPSSQSDTAENLKPFLDTDYFDFSYGDTSKGDRIIDSQWITTTIYKSTVFGNQQCFFGVNFADGRIKCYPTRAGGNNGYYLRYVRGTSGYGTNKFIDNENETITDQASSLMWQQNDSGKGMDWGSALTYCENLSLAGYTDWRLPNPKELEFIVDYTRSPDTTNSPAIDPIFQTSSISNESGQKDYPYFWTGTTHINNRGGVDQAVYIAFGRGLGSMNNKIMDVHGAGSQRSDPKSGNIADYPKYFGPQGDVRRLYNYARCVRAGVATPSEGNNPATFSTEYSFQNIQPPGQQQKQRAQGQPPQAAISACSGKTANTSCTMQTPKGTLTESCTTTPGGQLFCIPK